MFLIVMLVSGMHIPNWCQPTLHGQASRTMICVRDVCIHTHFVATGLQHHTTLLFCGCRNVQAGLPTVVGPCGAPRLVQFVCYCRLERSESRVLGNWHGLPAVLHFVYGVLLVGHHIRGRVSTVCQDSGSHSKPSLMYGVVHAHPVQLPTVSVVYGLLHVGGNQHLVTHRPANHWGQASRGPVLRLLGRVT